MKTLNLVSKGIRVLKYEGLEAFVLRTKNYLARRHLNSQMTSTPQAGPTTTVVQQPPMEYVDFLGTNFFNFSDFLGLVKSGQYRGIYILGSLGLGWFDCVKQRHHHIAEYFMEKNYLVICAMNPVHEADNTPTLKQVGKNLVMVNFYNRSYWIYMLQMMALECDLPKIYHIVGTDTGTSLDDIKWLKSIGYSIEFEVSDEISREIFPGITNQTLERYEAVLHDEDVVVVTTADRLYQKAISYRKKNVVLSPNAATVSDWIFPTGVQINPPEELKELVEKGKTIVGFYGSFGSWLDYDYIRYLAESRPDYAIVMIGYDYDSGTGGFAKSKIGEVKNVHVISAKPYKQLKYYSHFFDVAILPFRQYGLSDSVSPVKIFEHMAQRIPVVATDIYECRKYPTILLSKSKQEFVENVDKGIRYRKDAEYGDRLFKCAMENSWSKRAEPILMQLEKNQSDLCLYRSKDKLLTIIVPAYNMQRYINRCLDAITHEVTRKYLEILIINDGSNDNTRDIANFYADKYPSNVKLVNKENGGHGSCINKGIELATGKYIKLVDSDDFLDAEALLKHVLYLKNCDDDMVLTDYNRFYDDRRIEHVSYQDRLDPGITYTPSQFYTALRKDRYFTSYAHMHSITYKTDLLKKQNIKITENSPYVDQEYITLPLAEVESISYQPIYLYHYFIGRPGQSVDPKVARKKAYMNFNIMQNIKRFYMTIKDPKLKDYLANILLHQTLYWMSCSDDKDAKARELEWWKKQDLEIFSIMKGGVIK